MVPVRLRRLALSLLVLAMSSTLLAACGSTSAPPAPVQTGQNPPSVPVGYSDTSAYKKNAPYRLCFSNASVSNSWRVGMMEHLRYEVSQHPEIGTFRPTDANDDAAQQAKDVETLLSQGCDVLLISAALKSLGPAVDKAAQQGVPVVTIDRSVDTDKNITHVTANQCDMATIQAEWLVKELKGKGNIVLLSGIKNSGVADDRLRCAREVFAKHPDIKELAQAFVNWSDLEAKQAMAKWVKEFPQIDGIWSDGGMQAVGAVEFLVEQGMPVPPITGEDNNRYLKLWKKHNLRSIGVSNPIRQGQEAVKVALDILAGKPVPRLVNVKQTVVTNETLDQYVQPKLPDDYWADSNPEVMKIMFPGQ